MIPTEANPEPRISRTRWVAPALNLLASIQLVWFYLLWVAPFLNASLYEQGLERLPYQGRMLMIWPMRWAHDSFLLTRLASRLTYLSLWFEYGVRPEGLLEFAVDLLSLAVTGIVARAIYRAASPRRLLESFVYPLTLVMVLVTYCVQGSHHLRMYYDLPGLALFSLGLYLIYFRKSVFLFSLLFLVATINRETSILLLVFLVLSRFAQVAPSQRGLKLFLTPSLLLPCTLLTAFWLGWRRWVNLRFANNPTESAVRLKHNVYLLLNPLSWPQLLCVAAFMVPLILLHRRIIGDPVLRTWLTIIPIWFVFMMLFGVIIEVRVFGELIPYLACCAALIAEQSILQKLAPANQDQHRLTHAAEI